MTVESEPLNSVAQVLGADGEHIAMATLVGERHLITCAHVIKQVLGTHFHPTMRASKFINIRWLAAPDTIQQAEVVGEGWVAEDDIGRGDLAVLRLDATAPSAIRPVRVVESAEREGDAFRAYGANANSGTPVRIDGKIRGREGPAGTWIRITVEDFGVSTVTRGFSGSAVFDVEAGGAIGIIVSRDTGEGSRSAFFLPIDQLVKYWQPLEKHVVSRFELSVEAREHWLPRGRGVGSSAETGWFFTGRRAIVDELTARARNEDGHHYFCVSGAPGIGKSSILSRLPIIADSRLSSIAAGGADDIRLTACDVIAIYLRQMSFSETISKLAELLGTSATGPEGIVDAVRRRSDSRRHMIFVFDGLDEAADQPDRIRIARDLIRRLGNDAQLLGITVVASCRSGVTGSDNETVLEALGSRCNRLQADSVEYVSIEDFVRFVEDRLSAADESLSYGDELLESLAYRVAEASFPVYLVAQLVTRSLIDDREVTEAALDRRSFPETVGEAFEGYLRRFGNDERRLRDLLCGLAHARGTGFELGRTWLEVVADLTGRTYVLEDLEWLLASGAAFLIETVDSVRSKRYRLYHQALVDLLVIRADSAKVYHTILRLRREAMDDWYLEHHLSGHAVEAGEISDLLLSPSDIVLSDVGVLLQDAARYGVKLSPNAEQARMALRSVAFQLGSRPKQERSAYLSLAGYQYGIVPFRGLVNDGWWRPWYSDWEASTEHTVVRRGSPYSAVGVANSVGEPVVVAADANGVVSMVWASDHAEAFESFQVLGVPTCMDVCEFGDGRFAVAIGTDTGESFCWDSVARRPIPSARFKRSVTSASIRERPYGFEVLWSSYDGSVCLQGRIPGRRLWERRADVGEEVLSSCFVSPRETFIAIGTSANVRVLRHENLGLDPYLGASEIGPVMALHAMHYEADRELSVVVVAPDMFSRVGLEYENEVGIFPELPIGRSVSIYQDAEAGFAGLSVERDIYLQFPRGAEPALFTGHEDDISGLALLRQASGAELVSASIDGTLRVWPLKTGVGRPDGSEERSDVHWVELSPFGEDAVLVSFGGEVVIVSEGCDRVTLETPPGVVDASFDSIDVVRVVDRSGASRSIRRSAGEWSWIEDAFSHRSITARTDASLEDSWLSIRSVSLDSHGNYGQFLEFDEYEAMENLIGHIGGAMLENSNGRRVEAIMVDFVASSRARILINLAGWLRLYSGSFQYREGRGPEDVEDLGDTDGEWSWSVVSEFEEASSGATSYAIVARSAHGDQSVTWLCDSSSLVVLDSDLTEVARILTGGGDPLHFDVVPILGRDREFNFAIDRVSGLIIGTVSLASFGSSFEGAGSDG